MATLTAIPVEQYLRTYYDPDMEYVDGRLLERHAGEYFHSRLQKTPVLTQPDLAIEVISPDDEPTDMLFRISDYQHAGIPYIWVVDPYKRTLVESVGSDLRRPGSLVLSTPLVGEINFADLFARLDEPTE